MLHQLRIFVNQRLAFGPVGDHVLDLRLRFHIRGKAGPAGAHHTQFPQLLAKHKPKDSLLGQFRIQRQRFPFGKIGQQRLRVSPHQAYRVRTQLQAERRIGSV